MLSPAFSLPTLRPRARDTRISVRFPKVVTFQPCRILVIVDDHSRRTVHFDLCAHFLQACSKRFNLLPLLSNLGLKVFR